MERPTTYAVYEAWNLKNPLQVRSWNRLASRPAVRLAPPGAPSKGAGVEQCQPPQQHPLGAQNAEHGERGLSHCAPGQELSSWENEVPCFGGWHGQGRVGVHQGTHHWSSCAHSELFEYTGRSDEPFGTDHNLARSRQACLSSQSRCCGWCSLPTASCKAAWSAQLRWLVSSQAGLRDAWRHRGGGPGLCVGGAAARHRQCRFASRGSE